MLRTLVGLFTLLLAAAAQGELSKYKNWLDSPEAYFLTKAERQDWRKVKTDAEAALFVNRFVERRGGMAFKAIVEHRTGIADSLFSTDRRRGSSTLRGKLVILLGAPSHVGASSLKSRSHTTAAPPPPAVTNLGGGSGGAPGAPTVRVYRYYWLTFPAKNLPVPSDEDYVANIEVDHSSGADQLVKGASRKRLAELIDAAIEASITKR